MSDRDDFSHLPVGSVVGGYEILRVLGSGGFGVTYLAKHQFLGRTVALKECLPVDFAWRRGDSTVGPRGSDQAADFEWAKERFLQEAQTLAQFSHENVVHVYDVFEANGTAYMPTGYVEGQDLETWLRRLGRPPAEVELLPLLKGLISGLSAVHAGGVLHRDIKPENIYVTDTGKPVLLDFGSARQSIGGRSRSLTTILTPGYAPPEQYFSDGNQGAWTDVYGLCATLHRCLCGDPPPEGSSRDRRGRPDPYIPMSKRLSGKYSDGLLSAIDAGLATNERERPATVDSLRDRCFLSENGVPKAAEADATPPEPSRPAAKQSSQSQRSLIIGGLLVVLVAFVFIVTRISSTKEERIESAGGWLSLSLPSGMSASAGMPAISALSEVTPMNGIDDRCYLYSRPFQPIWIAGGKEGDELWLIQAKSSDTSDLKVAVSGSLLRINNTVRAIALSGSERNASFERWYRSASAGDFLALDSVSSNKDSSARYRDEINKILRANPDLVESTFDKDGQFFAIRNAWLVGDKLPPANFPWEKLRYLMVIGEVPDGLADKLIDESPPLTGVGIAFRLKESFSALRRVLQNLPDLESYSGPYFESVPRMNTVKHLTLFFESNDPQSGDTNAAPIKPIRFDVNRITNASRLVSFSVFGDAEISGNFAGLEYLSVGRAVLSSSETLSTKLKYFELTKGQGLNVQDAAKFAGHVEGLVLGVDFEPADLGRFRNLKYLGLPKSFDEGKLKEIRRSYPNVVLYTANGICMGSGWLMVLALCICSTIIFKLCRSTARTEEA